MTDASDALQYHKNFPCGKISVVPTKPCDDARDLSLAYTPGVAKPCLEIKEKPETVWDYTSKGNFVAVVSDGTAVLGLGNIGPEAGLPVMEGKAVLFKRFADIDAIGICLGKVFNEKGRTDPARLIAAVETHEPSVGGINLDDIGSPACFEVEATLKRRMGIPVFHDDQHGTAIISMAAIKNALKILGKKLENCRFAVSGAGAAGVSCCEFYIKAGARRENFLMCDSKGVIHKGRTDLNEQKARFAADTPARTLADAVRGADIFLGFSAPGCLTAEMVATMAENPVIFAMANPTPEIFPDVALAAGAAVVGTGRSDFPNQINNVLGFPGIFRGALDVRACDINDAMKLAASDALAELAELPIPPEIRAKLALAYPEDAKNGMFDKSGIRADYVIPKPFDERVVPHVARRVAEAAIATGVARIAIRDFDAYEKSVVERIARNSAAVSR
ncbi:MAG: NAD-dependent malic enzyme [Victivallaceae bacterium]|nr:NAD-dependent malic enzyme [Victivallaceae bacterium]